jgi:hypothetical protein
MTDHDKKVQKYITSFADLQAKFESESNRVVEITIHRTLAVVENICG